jgi:hypothetical protein
LSTARDGDAACVTLLPRSAPFIEAVAMSPLAEIARFTIPLRRPRE